MERQMNTQMAEKEPQPPELKAFKSCWNILWATPLAYGTIKDMSSFHATSHFMERCVD